MPEINFYKQELGAGIFTASDISAILHLPEARIRRFIKEYGNAKFGIKLFNQPYSWEVAGTQAVNFYALIELYVFYRLREKFNLSTAKINKARETMAKDLDTPYPFANTKILADKKTINYIVDEMVVNADGSKQINMDDIVEPFLEKIDFGADGLADRYFPLGKNSTVVVDPRHQYGQPTVEGTNIRIETIYSMLESGEPEKNIMGLYDLTKKQVSDAMRYYYKKAA